MNGLDNGFAKGHNGRYQGRDYVQQNAYTQHGGKQRQVDKHIQVNSHRILHIEIHVAIEDAQHLLAAYKGKGIGQGQTNQAAGDGKQQVFGQYLVDKAAVGGSVGFANAQFAQSLVHARRNHATQVHGRYKEQSQKHVEDATYLGGYVRLVLAWHTEEVLPIYIGLPHQVVVPFGILQVVVLEYLLYFVA